MTVSFRMMDVYQTQLEQKKELFHRVSNNFQIIQSMIRLVARDPEIADLAAEMEERIQLLSIAHDVLHGPADAGLAPPERALPSLIAGLQRAGYFAATRVVLDMQASPMTEPRIYALLHIVTEIARAMERSAATRITLTVSPQGLSAVADTDDVDFGQSARQLTRAFARELGGDVRWQPEGVQVIIG